MYNNNLNLDNMTCQAAVQEDKSFLYIFSLNNLELVFFHRMEKPFGPKGPGIARIPNKQSKSVSKPFFIYLEGFHIMSHAARNNLQTLYEFFSNTDMNSAIEIQSKAIPGLHRHWFFY